MQTWIVYLIDKSIVRIECETLKAAQPNCYDFVNKDVGVIVSIPSSSVLMIVSKNYSEILKLERDLF